jgi:predicted DNA-binding protein
LEKTTKKTKDFYIQQALIRYLEDLEDLQIGLERLKKKDKIFYTSEELSKKLGL